MGKVRVPLHGKTQGYTTVDPSATNGAVVGVNLFWGDGVTLVTEADFNPAPGEDPESTSGVGGVSQTLWSLILQIPANVTALEEASGTGLFAVTGVGTGAMREITITAGELTVADGDGVAGDPLLGLADTAVTPGTYTNATVTFDAKGRATFAESGAGGGFLPLVTGEISGGQPVFVYGPDGSLIYFPVA